MKINEAPTKIYLDEDESWNLTNPNGYSIEYVRKDAFIEKACEFLYSSSILRNTHIVERFKEYMKGE